jgi:siroheme synthase-like protein
MSDARVLHPLFVDLAGRDVLVVGGGPVAERKVAELLDAGASVRVVAKSVTPALEELASSGDIVTELRAFEASDVHGAWLVLASTSDPVAQRFVAHTADAARIFCVAVDDPKNASAYGGSVLRRGPVTVAISTSGEAPALARLVREVLEQALPESDWIDAARSLRDRWKKEGTPMASRFTELVRAFKERAG